MLTHILYIAKRCDVGFRINNGRLNTIKLNQFFISPDITVVEQNTKKSFPRESIFAIQLTNGQNYRFINRKPYLIADTSFLYIYTRNDVKTEYQQSGPHTIHKEIPVTVYYFSFGDHKRVYSLTLQNLRKYILIDPVVHTAVCNKFTNFWVLAEKYMFEENKFIVLSGPNFKLGNVRNVFVFLITPY